jgi:hypothetical protein
MVNPRVERVGKCAAGKLREYLYRFETFGSLARQCRSRVNATTRRVGREGKGAGLSLISLRDTRACTRCMLLVEFGA